MRKFAIAAIAAIAATVSLSSVAEAHRHHHDDDWGRPHCAIIKIVKFDHHGNKIIKIIKKCRH